MNGEKMEIYLVPLILTIIIEYVIVKLFFLNEKVIMNVLFVNLITNPALNLFVIWLEIHNYENIWPIIYMLEILIFIAEGIMYKHLFKISYKKGIIVAFVSNLATFLCSFLLA